MIRRAVLDDMPNVLEIRRVVFMNEQGVSEEEERDGQDKDALHYIAFHGVSAVGTARVLVKDKTGKIGRVAVLAKYRGTGIGTEIMQFLLDDLRAEGLKTAQLAAQTHALGFYEALGFSPQGADFMDAGIPHRNMTLEL